MGIKTLWSILECSSESVDVSQLRGQVIIRKYLLTKLYSLCTISIKATKLLFFNDIFDPFSLNLMINQLSI